MTQPQLTLVQIDNYGPWTATPEPRPECDIQALQAELFADLVQFVGRQSGYLFPVRFDNMVGLTNGLDRDDHARIQASIATRYPVTVSMGVAAARTPTGALSRATANLQAAGSAQDDTRRSVLRGETLGENDRRETDVQIAHFDAVDATARYTDELDAFEAHRRITRGYVTLADHLYEHYDALAFFVGGDNVIAISPGLGRDEYRAFVDHVEDAVSLPLQIGVGRGATARQAGMAAKRALEACREDETRVETTAATRHGP